MAAIDMDRSTLPRFIERVERIDEKSERLWGKFSVTHMLAHLIRSVEISLGEVEVSDKSNFLIRNIARPLIFSGFMPWPKGRIKTLPVYLVEPEGDLDSQKKNLAEGFKRFVDAAEAEPEKPMLHPAFGNLPLRGFRRIHGMHCDHHLRQFGV